MIDSLIRIKGTSRPGAAFRPGREADMMRRLVARHAGALPLATVEHIWREIITTFTRMQAPFDVAIDVSVEPERMRDLARFYFGFSVELVPLAGAGGDRSRVSPRPTTSASSRATSRRSAGAWWRGLVGATAPRIMALLPFIGAEGRPADLPAFVISPPLADPTPPDIAHLRRADARAASTVVRDAVVLGARGRRSSCSRVPARFDAKAIAAHVDALAEVGGICPRHRASARPDSLLYRAGERRQSMSADRRPAGAAPRRARHRALRARPVARRPAAARLHKLSSNETPLGPSPAAIEAYRAGRRQPRISTRTARRRALRAAIGAAYGLNPDRIVCGAGSDEILNLIAHAYIGPGDEAIHTEHGFLVYPIAIKAAGGTPVVAPETNLTADVDAILARVSERTRVVFLANPNNPTGTYLPFSEVRRLHAGLPARRLLVLDAAYAEYVRRNDYESGIELAGTADNVVMTRTFSKIYGLAGLRIGWGYGAGARHRRAQPHPRPVQRVDRRRSPRASPRSATAPTSSAPSRTTRRGCRR